MTLKPNDINMFLAYHIRSSFLTCEASWQDKLVEWGLSSDHFYVLRSDWTPVETSLAEISAHAMQTYEQALKVLTDLIAQGYVVKGDKDDHFSLSSKGAAVRTQVLEKYREHLATLTEGLSEETIETSLSTLLTIQNNIQLS